MVLSTSGLSITMPAPNGTSYDDLNNYSAVVKVVYGNIQFGKDVWREMFDKALECEKVKTGSELVPYWGLAPSEDMVKIQRIVPLYPFSRDLVAYERLIKILSLYRLTLGQTRQEELLEYIFMNQPEGIDLSDMFMNLSPFYKL